MLVLTEAVHTNVMRIVHNISIGHGHSLLNIVLIVLCK